MARLGPGADDEPGRVQGPDVAVVQVDVGLYDPLEESFRLVLGLSRGVVRPVLVSAN